MPKIHEDILQELTKVFLSSNKEQGFLLGCTTRLEQLDSCHQIPAAQSGKYFYSPDSQCADAIIRSWAELSICFCGFIHSHLGKNDLSENDIEFANQLFRAYTLPVLWFGIGVVNEGKVDYRFYAVSSREGGITINPVSMETID